MQSAFRWVGRRLADFLSRPRAHAVQPATSLPEQLRATIRPGDVLLVDGDSLFSAAIKYLTQSTWSHAALYIGDALGAGEPRRDLIEVDLLEGVRAVPLETYAEMHTRICRPAGARADDLAAVIAYAVSRLGDTYDLKNVVDLARYLLPTPPIPARWRRRALALGSGEPTRAICSTLIAQAFQSIGYPILPEVERRPTARKGLEQGYELLLHIRHYSLFAPRDFDVSPYFAIVKPTLEGGFDFRALPLVR